MDSRTKLAVGLTAIALSTGMLAPSIASARDAIGRMHFHPFAFVETHVNSVGSVDAAGSMDVVDHVVCPVRQVLTPQGTRLLEACD